MRDTAPRGRLVLAALAGLALITAAVIGRLPGLGGAGLFATGQSDTRAAMLAVLEEHHYRTFDAGMLAAAPIDAWPSILDDRHTAVVPAEAVARRAAADAAGHVGIGLRVHALADGTITVDAVADDSPAEQGGLRPGDELVAVDDRPVTGMGADAALDLIRGPEGSAVTVTVRRPGAEVSVTTQRGGGGPPGAVRTDLYEDGGRLIGLVTVPELAPGVGGEVREAVADLTTRGAAAFVLDLREAPPGGALTDAVDVAGVFLPTGSTVAIEQGRTIETTVATTREAPADTTTPLVVLVDGLTAGTAEVVAGALADNDRATVVGDTTFGQGGIQDTYPLPGGDALRTTYAEYLTPDGNPIERHGITPDVAVPQPAGEGGSPVTAAGAVDGALDAALRTAADSPDPAGPAPAVSAADTVSQ